MNKKATIKLVVGLGNPGKKYDFTKHNLGRMLFDYLPFKNELSWNKKFKGSFSSWRVSSSLLPNYSHTQIHFLFPETYMNLSGESVQVAMAFFGISAEEVLVIHDELDLPFGEIAFKFGGGLSGHNGLKSIASSLSSQNFYRLRLGISRPPHPNWDIADWVLTPFSSEESRELGTLLSGSSEALILFLKEGMGKASTFYNKKSLLST